MKTNKYAELIKFGLSSKTLMVLKESDINKLHKNFIEDKKDVCSKCGMTNCKCTHKKTETKEEDGSITPLSQLPQQRTTKTTRTLPATKATDVNGIKITSGSSPTKIEMPEAKKKTVKKQKPNPFSICHSQVGPKKTRKFERCVKAVKEAISENKNPFDVILENKILSLVEKHLNPKMTKGELMNLLGIKIVNESGTKEAPVKNPDTKKPPKTKDPFRPEPHKEPKPKAEDEKPKPRAKDEKPKPRANYKKRETKEYVMDAPAPTKNPKVDPGTKTPSKPKIKDPLRPEPHKEPKPKAKLPSWLKFNNLGIKFKK
jgi:hypothetical protein